MSPKQVTLPLDIYVRVSDTKGRTGDSFQSPKEQEERCRALAVLRGYEVGQVFKELDVSGGKMQRPLLSEAIARIEAGESGGIMVARLDRFARSLIGGLQTLERINNLGGVVIVADGEYDTSTAQGEMVLNMMLTLAQWELRRISDKWVDAKSRAVGNGKHISRHVPPGYERANGHLTPHPKHSKTIAEAFSMAARGTAPAEIASYLNERGLPSGKNERPEWKSSRISRLLANRVYLGEARASGDIVNPTAHEPLTDLATFSLAQRRSTATASGGPANHLLSGLVRCASCSAAMRGQKESQWAPAAYRCSGGGAGGKCPAPSTITMQKLDDLVYELWSDRMFDQRPTEQVRDDADISELEAEHEAARQELAAYVLHTPAATPGYQDGLASRQKAVDDALSKLTEQSQHRLEIDARIQEAMPQLIEQVKATAAEAMSYLEAGRPVPTGFFLDGLTEDGKRLVRHGLAREIQAIFVRPPARRSKSLPIADRVKVVWRDEDEKLELPTRGEAWTPRAYEWS